MNHGSLFSGIGGFELAAQWMGWQNIFHCEWNPFGQQILKHHFPESLSYTDVTKFCATAYAGRIDILTGGFPCQPYSTAGKRLGKEDERHLWPEMLRVIRECAPRYVVGENVRGLVSWNGGLVFEEVCADLEAEGYTVQPFLLPAAGVGAPHRRDRIWFVAYSNNQGGSDGLGQVQGPNAEVRQRHDGAQPCHAGSGNASDTKCFRLQHTEESGSLGQGKKETRQCTTKSTETNGFNGHAANTYGAGKRKNNGQRKPGQFDQTRTFGTWENFPTVTPVCRGNDGLSKKLDGITFSKWRNETIKAYGNAIVPQVALQIFKAIQMMEDEGW